MVNGPLTPPPTTATELQDEARENPSTVEASTSLPQSRPEHYQLVLASIAEAISNQNYSQVTNIAQEADYEVSSLSSLSFYSFIYLRFRR
jgi:COP9 signalosome complex subunit 8